MSNLKKSYELLKTHEVESLFPNIEGTLRVALSLAERELEGKGKTPTAEQIFGNLQRQHEHDAKAAILAYRELEL